jgi:hypothetical protein
MLKGITWLKMKTAEAAWIVKTQPMIAGQFDINMIVQFGWRLRADNSETTRHTKMYEQSAHMSRYEDVFATTSNVFDLAANKAGGQVYRPPQARLPNFDSQDRLIKEEGLYAPPSRFDFG